MREWDAWISREELRRDRVDEGLVARWCAMLDREPRGDGDVPQGLHWCLCLPEAPTARLGADGHPLREDNADSWLPPIALPRRMWAASKVEFLAPLRCGDRVSRVSRIASIVEKHGGSGVLVFVDLVHETSTEAGPALRETQTIVYRPAAPAAAPVPPPPGDAKFDWTGWDAHRLITPSEALLFRFSALTFNSHRIHYDLPYAVRQEGYRGLIVQGPLTATLLLDLAQRQFGDNGLKRFEFRGVSPAICGEDVHLVLRGGDSSAELAAYAGDGRQVMIASATI